MFPIKDSGKFSSDSRDELPIGSVKEWLGFDPDFDFNPAIPTDLGTLAVVVLLHDEERNILDGGRGRRDIPPAVAFDITAEVVVEVEYTDVRLAAFTGRREIGDGIAVELSLSVELCVGVMVVPDPEVAVARDM